MTWTAVVANGGGPFELRLVIGGGYREWCTEGMVEGAATYSGHDGRRRVHGLKRDGIEFGETGRITDGLPDQQAFTARIIDVSAEATAEFTTQPSVKIWLDSSIDSAETDIDGVLSSTPPSGAYYHIGTECVYRGAGTPATWTRFRRSTMFQAHWVSAGDRELHPELTDVPVLFNRRRVALYAHGPTETGLDAPGTLIWRGVIRGEPRESGGEWSISLDPLVSIFDFELADEVEMHPIGIYYPAEFPFFLKLFESDVSNYYTAPTTTLEADIILRGFWATQAAFVDALNAEIVAQIGSFDGEVYASELDGGWTLYLRTGTGAYAVRAWFANLVDGAFHNPFVADGAGAIVGNEIGGDLSADTTYQIGPFETLGIGARLRRVPRALYQVMRPIDGTPWYTPPLPSTTELSDYPLNRIYIDNATLVSVGDHLSITGAAAYEDSASDLITAEVSAVDTSTGAVDFIGELTGLPIGLGTCFLPAFAESPAVPERVALAPYFLDEPTDLDGLRFALAAYGGDTANRGLVPLINNNDLTSWETVVDEATGGRGYLTLREYVFSDEVVNLRDVVNQELRLLGCFAYTEKSDPGYRRIAIRPLSPALASDPNTLTIDATDRTIVNGYGDVQPVRDGIINVYRLKTGYSRKEGKHLGPTWVVPNIKSIARNAGFKRELVVEPKVASQGAAPSIDDVTSFAAALLAFMGDRYFVIEIGVTLALFDTEIGTPVTLTVPQLPWNGVRGLDASGIVIADHWDLHAGHGTLTILLHDTLDIAGYSPSARVASSAFVSGTTYDLTMEASRYAPSGGGADASYFADGDRVRLLEWNATGAGTLGTVSGTPSGNVVRVVFDSAPTLTGTRELIYVDRDEVVANGNEEQLAYAFVGDSARTLDGASTPARVYSP